ncbi:MAG: NADH-quinone oxidoreductase subunit M [Acidiphilium sp.]|nr:NADH-quinone oxidoreductase subunit M [Acidiphilium sp.]MDD4936573.1 NADH-quinone oxidoreductase subunit M [Acidiphilium sp.]
MILVWLLVVPFLGGLLAWPSGRVHPVLPRVISFAALLLELGLLLPLLHGTAPASLIAPGHWLATFNAPWIPAFGISFRLDLDGLSWLLIVLTVVIGLFSVVVSWREIDENVGFFHANLMWSLAGSIGVFLALDLFLFFFFWEVMLVPMYFVIAIWGHENRRRAAIKFFLFTQGSGLLMLLSILALAFLHDQQTGTLTFDYFKLLENQPTGTFGYLIMLGFFIAFLVKLPSFPVHTWLPETHTEAPTAGSVILASILLKTAAYGLLRFAVPLFVAASHQIAPIAMGLGVISIFYGAILAYGQNDLKKLVAYSSISHMGFVLVGIYTFNAIAWQGVVILMIAHGISTGALFITVGSIQKRLHTRDLGQMGGLWTDLPRLSSFGAFFILASMGLPGLGNFVGEFLILRGAYAVAPTAAIIAAIGLIPAALYSLIAIQRAFHGEASTTRSFPDFGLRETAMMLALGAAIIALGIYPQPVLNVAAPGLANLTPTNTTAALPVMRTGT